MQEIIAALSEIDEKSAKIMEAANNELKSLNEKLSIRKETYLSQARQNNQMRLDALRRQLKEESDKQLQKQSTDSTMALSGLEKDYKDNHKAIANRIFYSIIHESPAN